MTTSLLLILAFVVVLFAVITVLAKKSRETQKPESASSDSYELRASIFSPAERSFFGVLEKLNYEGITLTAKVRLADIFEIKKGLDRSERQRALNRISAKHVDFLLLRKADGRPLLGIERDDASHERIDRKTRDRFVDELFAAGKLPIVHVPAQHTYNVQEIHAILDKAMSAT